MSGDMASKADRHILYQLAVQDVESEIDFVVQTWGELRQRPAYRLREDFCGTANTSCEWVRRHPENRATGVDLDPEVLAWGREHNAAELTPDQQQRLRLIQSDVRDARTPGMDVVLAMNFSYYLFMDRSAMLYISD